MSTEININGLLEKSLWQMTGEEYCQLTQYALPLSTGTGTAPSPSGQKALGVHALAVELGCSDSTIYALMRTPREEDGSSEGGGALKDAIVSRIGRRIVFDVDKAQQEKDEAEKKAKAAKAELSSAESKVTEKQRENDRLEQRIYNEQATLDGLQTEVAEKRREKFSIDTSNEWKDPALRAVSGYLVATDEVIKFAIEAIQDYAYSGTGGRGGNHGDCFRDNEAYIIKKVMTNLAAIAKTTFQAIGYWLVYVASRIARFNDWELNRAEREVKDVADGRYDWRIDRIDRGRGGGISR